MKNLKSKIPYLLTAVCAVVYVSLVFNNNLWLDEAFSASIIRCGFKEMLTRTANDTLPPFYNLAAWCFTRIFGYSSVTLKLFSVLPMVILMLIAAYCLTRCCSVFTACAYIMLITAMPYMLEHGVEIRMYSWALFFASASAIFAICMMKDMAHTEIWLIVCTVLGAYTHQYALITEVYIWLMLLVYCIKNRMVFRWLKYAALCIVLYIPCAVLTLFQMSRAVTYFSATAPSLKALLSSLRYPFVTHYTAVSALLLLSVAVLFAAAVLMREYTAAFYMIIYVCIAGMSYFVMAITDSSFFSSRYLMPAIGIMWLGAAVASGGVILRIGQHETSSGGNVRIARLMRCMIPALGAAVVVSSLVICYRTQYAEEYVDDTAFEEFIASTGEDDGYVIYENFPEIQICLEYYAPWLKAYGADELDGVSGSKYVFISGSANIDEESVLSEYTGSKKNYEAVSLGNYAFDRYTFKAYTLH